MSNAKECDRCHRFYSEPLTGIIDDYWRYSVIKDCHPYPETKLDLCPTCQKALKEWLKKEVKI